MLRLSARIETFPLRNPFVISRGAKTETVVVTAWLDDGTVAGWGECGPNRRYGETPEGVAAAIEALAGDVAAGLDRAALQHRLPPGAARNAVDCAFWDYEAKRTGRPAWQLAGLAAPGPVETAFTLSIDTPAAMAAAARAESDRPVLKLKLDGGDDVARVRAVREAAPRARLIVDANEAWSVAGYEAGAPALAELGVALIEQPFPAGEDEALAGLPRPVPVCADESFRDRSSLEAVAGRYDAVNVKLDKTGGLTEALATVASAHAAGLALMVGCMVGTSLAMAPAMLVAQSARFVDLDGPLLLAADRSPGLRIAGSRLEWPGEALWG